MKWLDLQHYQAVEQQQQQNIARETVVRRVQYDQHVYQHVYREPRVLRIFDVQHMQSEHRAPECVCQERAERFRPSQQYIYLLPNDSKWLPTNILSMPAMWHLHEVCGRIEISLGQ